LIDRTVQSMFATMPFLRPRHGTIPTPRIVIPSSATSPTTAQTLVVPMSSPTTISPCMVAVLILQRESHALLKWAKSSTELLHADDDALGAGFVVEHDRVGLRAALVKLGDDARRLIELLPVRRVAEHERQRRFSDDERDRAVDRDVHFLQRRARRERP